MVLLFINTVRGSTPAHHKKNNLNESGESDKGKDIPMDSNQAYETVDLHYEDPHSHGMRQGRTTTAECIYEQPAC